MIIISNCSASVSIQKSRLLFFYAKNHRSDFRLLTSNLQKLVNFCFYATPSLSDAGNSQCPALRRSGRDDKNSCRVPIGIYRIPKSKPLQIMKPTIRAAHFIPDRNGLYLIIVICLMITLDMTRDGILWSYWFRCHGTPKPVCLLITNREKSRGREKRVVEI